MNLVKFGWITLSGRRLNLITKHMMSERIIFVDENDDPIGAGNREEAWSRGVYLRVARVILFDEQGRILSQRRSHQKKSYANRWTDSASGHVEEGESYELAIARELKEELGITTPLRFVGKFASQDAMGDKMIAEYNAVFEGHIRYSLPLRLQRSEVSDTTWYDLDVLKRLIMEQPDNFVTAFRELITRYY